MSAGWSTYQKAMLPLFQKPTAINGVEWTLLLLSLNLSVPPMCRPLIFSQWTSTLDILEWLLDLLKLPYLRLDGSTAVAERLATVDQ